MRPRDTSPEAWAIYLDMLRQRDEGQRLLDVLALSDFARARSFEGLRQLHPDWPEQAIRDEFLRMILPPNAWPAFLRQ